MYNELVNKLLIGTTTTGEFRCRSRARRLLRGLAGGARQRLAMRSVVHLTRGIAQSSAGTRNQKRSTASNRGQRESNDMLPRF